MPRVVHFEIPAKDKSKVAGFYKEVFGWEFTKWEGPEEYWMVKTGPDEAPGINGGLSNPEYYPATVNTIGVPDIDAYLGKVTGNGGEIIMPKSPIPGVGWLAYCKDVEGTVFGMMQDDPNAGNGHQSTD